MKTLENFKNKKIVSNHIFGSSTNIVETPGGVFNGMEYESDYFYDDDRDGRWGRGESLELVAACPRIA